MADIVIPEFMEDRAIADISRVYTVLYQPDLVDRPDDLRAAVRGARALIIRNRTQLRGALLDAADSLETVGRLGVGLDNIDVDACKARGITVLPATGANDDSVAEYVVCAALMLVRGSYFSSDAVAAGQWPRNALVGHELRGRHAGFIGFGGIARRSETLLSALGMRTAAFDPHLPADHPVWQRVERMEFATLLRTVDVLSVHTPLTPETKGMIGSDALALMRPSAVLINTARGGIVDERALADALRAGRLAGAALDVFAQEPLPEAAGSCFSGLKNVILTPHIAGITEESNVRVCNMIRDRVLDELRKKQ